MRAGADGNEIWQHRCHAEYDSAVHLPVRTGLVAFPGCSDQLVDGNTYAQLSAVDLIQQLHCVITLVYKDTALETVNKEAFRECVKSLLKQSKMFTDKELDAMFA